MTLTEAISPLAHNPVLGVDYDIGWVGFSYYEHDLTSGAIAYGEHWERPKNGEPVSHTFILTGANQGIEAHIQHGVARFDLRKYSQDSNCKLYFKRPVGWTPELGSRIANAAAQYLGRPYDVSLIAADAICDMAAVHFLNLATHGLVQKGLCRLLDNRGGFICSELVATALQAQPELCRYGCLQNPADTIDPQILMDDTVLFPT